MCGGSRIHAKTSWSKSAGRGEHRTGSTHSKGMLQRLLQGEDEGVSALEEKKKTQ